MAFRARPRQNERTMSITFAEKLSRLPRYEAGKHADVARTERDVDELVKLNSNECPWGPHPDVVDAIARASQGLNRYPDQNSTILRRRIAERFDAEPGAIAVGNGSCELLLAAADALCEPGAEILYSWPAFSMYPFLAPLSGAREVRVPLTEDGTHDLDAMLTEITAATQLILICNPNNPTATHVPAQQIAEFLEQVPGQVTVMLDEAYIEMQVNDDPDATVDLVRQFQHAVVLRTFSKIYGLAGLRVGYGICSPAFRAAVDAVRQPFSVNALAQAAAAEAVRHQDYIADRAAQTLIERVYVEEELAQLGLETSATQANFSWIDLGERDEGEVVESLARAGVLVRAGAGLGGPGHIRVTYGTRAENEKFLAALGDAI